HRKNIRRYHDKCDRVVRLLNEIGEVIDYAIGRWILDERAKNGIAKFEARVVADLDLDTQRLGACLNDGYRLRVTIICDEKCFPIWHGRMTKRHRFGGRRGFVQERCSP